MGNGTNMAPKRNHAMRKSTKKVRTTMEPEWKHTMRKTMKPTWNQTMLNRTNMEPNHSKWNHNFSGRPQHCFFEEHIFEIIWVRNHEVVLEEETLTRTHGFRIIEEKPRGRNHGGGIMKEES